MGLQQRRRIYRRIQKARGGRTLIGFYNFDRECEPSIPWTRSPFGLDAKESLFRVLKETWDSGKSTGIDLCLYTRGGDTNAVWPIVSLIREFDPDFEVLVPFRCHSAGTMLALGAKRVIMSPLSELSPIDPTTGNQFNPSDASNPGKRLGISVEDVSAYRLFVQEHAQFLCGEDADPAFVAQVAAPMFARLTQEVHPVALGNVHRVHLQIGKLARKLLRLHRDEPEDQIDDMVKAMTTEFYSHLHMINRHEAKEILGDNYVSFASPALAIEMDAIMRELEDSFHLRRKFFLSKAMGDQLSDKLRFISGGVESVKWAYLNEAVVEVEQHSRLPDNVQVELPPGESMPIVPGLPREFSFQSVSGGWVRNTNPKGVTE
jgi:hypothetical protein